MIFIDTSAFLARYLSRDEHHPQAQQAFDRLARERRPVATTSHVLDETITLLGRWAGHTFAAERARSILASRILRILRPTKDDEIAALGEFERFADQHISYTDALSFVLMRQNGIREAFAYDRHFSLAGFPLWPDASS